jgi:hypothetical protein
MAVSGQPSSVAQLLRHRHVLLHLRALHDERYDIAGSESLRSHERGEQDIGVAAARDPNDQPTIEIARPDVQNPAHRRAHDRHAIFLREGRLGALVRSTSDAGERPLCCCRGRCLRAARRKPAQADQVNVAVRLRTHLAANVCQSCGTGHESCCGRWVGSLPAIADVRPHRRQRHSGGVQDRCHGVVWPAIQDAPTVLRLQHHVMSHRRPSGAGATAPASRSRGPADQR